MINPCSSFGVNYSSNYHHVRHKCPQFLCVMEPWRVKCWVLASQVNEKHGGVTLIKKNMKTVSAATSLFIVDLTPLRAPSPLLLNYQSDSVLEKDIRNA